MTLTQQFLIISLLPLSFIVMIFYAWRKKIKRRRVFWRWTLTLLLAAVWSSSILRFFGGETLPAIIIFNWGIVGSYALSLTAVALFLTTASYLNFAKSHSRVAMLVSLLLLGAVVALDTEIWTYFLPFFVVGNQRITQFDIWAAVLITSWLVPITAGWILAQQLKSNLSNSIYRNQVSYWLLVLSLFFVGFALASIRQLEHPIWQQLGVLVLIISAVVGTITLTRTHLPELQLASRQVLSRLTGTLIIFGLTWLALSFIVQVVTNLPEATAAETQTLILIIAAALFAALFTLVYRWVNSFMRRIFLRGRERDVVMADFSNVVGNMPDPALLGQTFLRVVQSNLGTDEVWLFLTDDGPAGKLILRPLASLGPLPRDIGDFAESSPFSHQLRQDVDPLVQSDIDSLEIYTEFPEGERELLARWDRILYKPLHAGDSLIGILALGLKYNGEGYTAEDFALLEEWSRQISPLLAQTRNAVSLRQINDYVFRQNQILNREKQHLQELVKLYAQFIDLISPDLRRPFTELNKEMQKYQAKTEEGQMVSEINQQISALRGPIDNLITVSARIQMRSNFEFKTIDFEALAQDAMRNLQSMAEARRVKIDLQADATLATAFGDEQQLLEAVQHLLHNAIKFNKIGGMVVIECGGEGDEIFLRVIDNGVGIPPERLETIWSGLGGLGSNGNSGRTGLGLALTSFIVKAHGGRVTAESKYGSGSTFTIYLPLVYEE